MKNIYTKEELEKIRKGLLAGVAARVNYLRYKRAFGELSEAAKKLIGEFPRLGKGGKS
jgi:hypothetical protein